MPWLTGENHLLNSPNHRVAIYKKSFKAKPISAHLSFKFFEAQPIIAQKSIEVQPIKLHNGL
jgi:hypothetical protein